MEPISYIQIIGQLYPNVRAFDNSFAGYDYETIQLSAGSAPLPSKAELDAAILAASKLVKWREIQAERDRRKSAGAFLDPKWYHSDDTSRIQFIGMMLYGANLPAGILWKTLDGSFIEMTQAIVQQVFAKIAQHDTACFTVAEQRKGAVYAMTDPAAIVAYDHMTGTPTWPAVYGE